MSAASPFAILQDLDQRCRNNSRGLPAGMQVEEDWIGIGFKLAGQRLVAKMSDVAEIISPPATIRVPGVQAWVKGLANVRGTLMPILNMNLFLQGSDSAEDGKGRILVINKQNVVAGLQVQEVFGLRRFKPEMRSTEVASKMGQLEPYLKGAFAEGKTQWNVFSIEKLVTNDQFLKVV